MGPLAWLVVAAELFNGATGALADVVPPRGLTVSAASCAPCHAALVDEWRQSAHADAFTNALFVASFRSERRAWCVSCHAPLPEQAAGALRDEGVGCAACHVRDGAILAVRPPTAKASAAHPVRVEPRLGQADFCGGCHQVNWPTTLAPLRYGPHPMQDTVEEWRHSGSAASCVDCHFAAGHRVVGGHDAGWVARALTVAVARTGPARARVIVRSHGVGHAVPTGDPFRRLVLELCATPSCTPALAELVLGRRFDGQRDGRLVADTTVPAGGERRLELDAPPAATVWRLVYRYAAAGTERELSDDERQQEIAVGHIEGGER